MIISKIIQNGLDLSIETNDIPFQYSSNLYIQFVKDDAYKNWNLEGYYCLPQSAFEESKEFLLDINSDGTFKLTAKMFEKQGTIQFSFKLIENDNNGANVHLGIVPFTIRKAIGNTSTVLPEDDALWYELVRQEVQKYLGDNYQSNLKNLPSSDTITENDTIITNIDSETKQITLSNFIEAIKGKVGGGGTGSVSYDTSTGDLTVQTVSSIKYDDSTGNLQIGG